MTLEFKKTKSREIFHFNRPLHIQGSWMVRSASVEVYISFLNILEQNNKFTFHKFLGETIGAVSYEKGRDKIEKVLDITDFTATDLQDDITGPIIIDEYREQVTKKGS